MSRPPDEVCAAVTSLEQEREPAHHGDPGDVRGLVGP